MNQKKLEFINIQPYSKDYFEILSKNEYKRLRKNKNNFSFWYPKIKDCGIPTANALIFRLSFKTWKLIENLYKDRYTLANDFFYQSDNYKEWQKQINRLIKNVPDGHVFNLKSRNFF